MKFTPELKAEIEAYFDNMTDEEVLKKYSWPKPGFAEKREKQLINEYCISHYLIIHEFTGDIYSDNRFIAYNTINKVFESYRIDDNIGIINEGVI